jgi:hypothetical protein
VTTKIPRLWDSGFSNSSLQAMIVRLKVVGCRDMLKITWVENSDVGQSDAITQPVRYLAKGEMPMQGCHATEFGWVNTMLG